VVGKEILQNLENVILFKIEIIGIKNYNRGG